MKILLVMMLLFGGCSMMFPSKYKREKSAIQEKAVVKMALKKV
jgi:hypothetical protein